MKRSIVFSFSATCAVLALFFLRTDKPEMDEKTMWSYYHIIREIGERSYWTEIVRTMSTQKLVRSTAVNALDEIVDMDICTKPTQAAAAIYDKLGFRHYPFRRMKICSAQTLLQKNLKC